MVKLNKSTMQFEFGESQEVSWQEAQEESDKFNPYMDNIWKKLFKLNLRPKRWKHTSDDIEQHIDGYFKLANQMKLYFQEKTHQTNWHTVTIEYLSDDKGTEGEWFNSRAQFHLEGYGHPDRGFDRWIVINVPYWRWAVAAGKIKATTDKPNSNKSYGTSNFWAYNAIELTEKVPEAVFAIEGNWQ